MRNLRRYSVLALLLLPACAEHHEDRSREPDPLQTAGATGSGDADEAPGNRTTQDDAEPRDEAPMRPAGEPEDDHEDVPPATTPAPTPTAAWTPVLDSFPGRLTGVADLCAKRTFDSLSPGDIQMPSPCSYRMPGWPKLSDPKFVRVIVDGDTRPLGQAANGWVVAEDGHSITLLGAACDSARAGTTISITIECTTVPAT